MNTNFLVTFKKNIVEFILIISATSISCFVFILYYQDTHSQPEVLSNGGISNSELPKGETYSIDISGAVVKPNVYEVTPGARMKDVIDLAGGFSKEANTAYVARHFNLAKTVADQEKIYIPTKEDTLQEDFSIHSQTIESTANISPTLEENTTRISINIATEEELDILPGIGPTTAKKIIENRPYTAVEELLSKKVTSQSTFNKIKDMVKL